MALRILMTGNDSGLLQADSEMLRQRGFRTYVCQQGQIIEEMIKAVKPDIVFIDPKVQDAITTNLYNRLLDNITHASVPIVYTLSEDDVYLITRKRTAMKEHRNAVSDNIIDAIKMALEPVGIAARKRIYMPPQDQDGANRAYRA